MGRDIEVISQTELDALWAEGAVDAKVANGSLHTIIIVTEPAKNRLYHGGTSRIVKVRTANGHHIGTFHEIEVPGSGILHRHPKDYTRRDCSRVRCPGEVEHQP